MINVKFVLPVLFLCSVSVSVWAESPPFDPGASVSVTRSPSGVPRISADNEYDLFYAQGRVHAMDRLFQMDMLRRSAAGTLAEVLGTDALETDVETRTIGLQRAAERSLAAHSNNMRDIFQAYSDGVNSFPRPPGSYHPNTVVWG